MEAWTIAMLIVGLITLYLTWEATHNEDPPPLVVNQTIINIQSGDTNVLPLPRDEACFCGSGDTFGRCHGLPDR